MIRGQAGKKPPFSCSLILDSQTLTLCWKIGVLILQREESTMADLVEKNCNNILQIKITYTYIPKTQNLKQSFDFLSSSIQSCRCMTSKIAVLLISYYESIYVAFARF